MISGYTDQADVTVTEADLIAATTVKVSVYGDGGYAESFWVVDVADIRTVDGTMLFSAVVDSDLTHADGFGFDLGDRILLTDTMVDFTLTASQLDRYITIAQTQTDVQPGEILLTMGSDTLSNQVAALAQVPVSRSLPLPTAPFWVIGGVIMTIVAFKALVWVASVTWMAA